MPAIARHCCKTPGTSYLRVQAEASLYWLLKVPVWSLRQEDTDMHCSFGKTLNRGEVGDVSLSVAFWYPQAGNVA